jgi:hypothetical protein
MAIQTIQEAVDRGYISTYLSANDNAKGNLFGRRIASPGSPVSIQLISTVLDWGNSGGAQTDQDLRSMANYLVWLCGMYGQQANAIIDGSSGGGTVIPAPSSSTQLFPIYITNADFTTATFYPNTNIFGNNVIIFLNELNRYLIPGTEFSVSASGITIINTPSGNLDGFDATINTYNLVIEKYNN